MFRPHWVILRSSKKRDSRLPICFTENNNKKLYVLSVFNNNLSARSVELEICATESGLCSPSNCFAATH